MTAPPKRYAERDHMALDREGGYYGSHVLAMTTEGLHDKADIAGELAWRDSEIDRLSEQRSGNRHWERAKQELLERVFVWLSMIPRDRVTAGGQRRLGEDREYLLVLIRELDTRLTKEAGAQNEQ